MAKKNKPTIVMPKEHLDAWLAALRSGQYRQTIGTMYCEMNNSYCCLGVLEMAVDGAVEKENHGVPSPDWLKEHNISFTYVYPEGERKKFHNPTLIVDGEQSKTATQLNDKQMSFAEIADLIEQNAKGI
jgi:hypothetical protein